MHKVATMAALRETRGLRVEIGDRKILLVRDGEQVRAFSALCPHAQAPLEEGAVCDGRIVCPWHKATFRLSDGALLEPPALDGLSRYPVMVDGDDILVSPEPLPQPSVCAAADDRVMLIAGAGAAGATAAAALRAFGFGGRVVLIGQEPGLPFDRTALSKFVLAGQMQPDDAPPILPAGFYAEHRIERIADTIRRFDLAARQVTLGSGDMLGFDAALIATGSVPVSLPIPGADLPGVHRLRTRADAASILRDARPGSQAVILGSSFIALEVASALRQHGVEVTVASPEDIPFARHFGPRIGQSLRRMHEADGVRFHLATRAKALLGTGRVETVALEDGATLRADVVIMGVGVRPATDFVHGLERIKDGGIPVDAGMRVAPSVYAAGDIAAFPLGGGGPPTRIEHWRVAQQQARVAARNMLGGNAVYDGVPFFWTYQGGKRFEYLGHAETWDDIVIDGDVDRQQFIAYLISGQAVRAVVACGREHETAILAERMRHKLSADSARERMRAA